MWQNKCNSLPPFPLLNRSAFLQLNKMESLAKATDECKMESLAKATDECNEQLKASSLQDKPSPSRKQEAVSVGSGDQHKRDQMNGYDTLKQIGKKHHGERFSLGDLKKNYNTAFEQNVQLCGTQVPFGKLFAGAFIVRTMSPINWGASIKKQRYQMLCCCFIRQVSNKWNFLGVKRSGCKTCVKALTPNQPSNEEVLVNSSYSCLKTYCSSLAAP